MVGSGDSLLKYYEGGLSLHFECIPWPRCPKLRDDLHFELHVRIAEFALCPELKKVIKRVWF
jgi:hypothetical protein